MKAIINSSNQTIYMNFIRKATSKIFGGGEAAPEEEQKHDPAGVNSEEDILNQCMPDEMQEEMFCFTMGDCQLSEIRPNHQAGN